MGKTSLIPFVLKLQNFIVMCESEMKVDSADNGARHRLVDVLYCLLSSVLEFFAELQAYRRFALPIELALELSFRAMNE